LVWRERNHDADPAYLIGSQLQIYSPAPNFALTTHPSNTRATVFDFGILCTVAVNLAESQISCTCCPGGPTVLTITVKFLELYSVYGIELANRSAIVNARQKSDRLQRKSTYPLLRGPRSGWPPTLLPCDTF